MAWLFADSFDLYATITEAGTHWDTTTGWKLGTGRFSGSQSFSANQLNATSLTKTSASNDATHHLVFSFIQTVALSGTVSGYFVQLQDTTNTQMTIVFRSDGAILFYSGGTGGTLLGTYAGAFVQNVWNGIEIEITIHNTTGAIHVRKNGSTSDDYALTSVNTRAGSTNNYANSLRMGFVAAASSPLNVLDSQKVDDFLWFSTSGAAPNTWVGDIRSCPLTPNGDASVQFAVSPAVFSMGTGATGSLARSANTLYMSPAGTTAAAYAGTVSAVRVTLNAGFTGNLKAAVYDSTRVTPLAVSNAVVNPTSGENVCTLTAPLIVSAGATYYFAVLTDTAFTINRSGGSVTTYSVAQTYGSGFPTSPVLASSTSQEYNAIAMTVTPFNYAMVAQAQQDGLTSYVYDSIVGHADFYDMTDLPFVPMSIIGLQTRGYVEKSDAGLRQAQLQVKSGATTVQSAVLTLATSFQYTGRVDTTDPNTGSAWTAAAVNAVQVGPYVTA